MKKKERKYLFAYGVKQKGERKISWYHENRDKRKQERSFREMVTDEIGDFKFIRFHFKFYKYNLN